MEEMSVRFVNIGHDTPMLLPPNLRDWVSPDHMVHFVMDAVVALDLSRARINERGTGSARYYSENSTLTVEDADTATTVYAAMKRQIHGLSIAQLEAQADPPPTEAPVAERMAHRLGAMQNRRQCRLAVFCSQVYKHLVERYESTVPHHLSLLICSSPRPK